MSDLKEVSIMFKDERIMKIKTRKLMKINLNVLMKNENYILYLILTK